VRNGLAGVSIVARSALAADCLSTGAFVLGLEAGLELIEKLPGVEAVFVTDERDVHLSSGLAAVFELLDESFHLASGG
jgi:thiamine biosynthesis lipoprotein